MFVLNKKGLNPDPETDAAKCVFLTNDATDQIREKKMYKWHRNAQSVTMNVSTELNKMIQISKLM